LGKIKIVLLVSFLLVSFSYQAKASNAFNVANSDTVDSLLFGYFDLRDRETFIQITNTDGATSQNLHIQVFNVDDNCNENDFFDLYTPNDTHVYNLRDIVTNDGNDSGVVLPSNAYGIIVVNVVQNNNQVFFEQVKIIGNMRIEDNNGYEYRTNLLGVQYIVTPPTSVGSERLDGPAVFNFNNEGGITFSDIVLITYSQNFQAAEVEITNVLDNWILVDVDIFDLNENPFSCRNVIFSCVDQDNPLLEALLEEVADFGNGSASVASFEYGINDVIPHSKGGELLCPGNNISEGFVKLKELSEETNPSGETPELLGFIGLNNGNGRGSMDAMFAAQNEFFSN